MRLILRGFEMVPARRALILCCVLVGFRPATAQAKVRVITTSPAFADITRQVGGDHVEAESLMRGPENAHHVTPKPSFIMKLRTADLFVHAGLDGEPWVPSLLKTARQKRFLPGEAGNVDVSRGIALKDVPERNALSRALGDIHVYGNPHYTLDPLNGIPIAHTIAEALARTDPANAAAYREAQAAYAERLRALTDRLTAAMAPYRGAAIVTYHRTWPYFLERFGLVKVVEVEPKPGLAPGPQHVQHVVETMRREGAGVIIVESYNPLKTARAVAERADAEAVVLAQEVGAVSAADTYEHLFEHNVDTLLAAFRAVGERAPATHGAAVGE